MALRPAIIDGLQFNFIQMFSDNIWSKLDFQGPGLKVKVTMLFLDKICHRSRAYIYWWILI